MRTNKRRHTRTHHRRRKTRRLSRRGGGQPLASYITGNSEHTISNLVRNLFPKRIIPEGVSSQSLQ